MKKELKLGSIYGFDGGNFAGLVYNPFGIAPSILTCQGGGRMPHVLVIVKEVRPDARRRSNDKDADGRRRFRPSRHDDG